MIKQTTKTDSLTTGDLDKIANLLDERLAPVATKEFVQEEIREVKTEMKEMERNLKGYIHEGIETVMAGIEDLSSQLAEKEKVERLVEWAREAGEKIGIKPKL